MNKIEYTFNNSMTWMGGKKDWPCQTLQPGKGCMVTWFQQFCIFCPYHNSQAPVFNRRTFNATQMLLDAINVVIRAIS